MLFHVSYIEKIEDKSTQQQGRELSILMRIKSSKLKGSSQDSCTTDEVWVSSTLDSGLKQGSYQQQREMTCCNSLSSDLYAPLLVFLFPRLRARGKKQAQLRGPQSQHDLKYVKLKANKRFIN